MRVRNYSNLMSTPADPPKPAAETDPNANVLLKTLAAEKAGALHPQDSVETAGDRMRERDAAAWPVAEDRTLVGMIDEKNPDWTAGGHGHDPKTEKVGAIMNREPIFCYEDEDCASALKLMEERDLRHLPVVDRQMRIVGIFSREEIKERVNAPGSSSPTAVRPAIES